MQTFITVDGNTAASNIAYKFSDMAIVYPITPSSPMAENVDKWQADNKTNLWGNKVRLTQMQSEAGAAAAMHGALNAGSLATTFTSSQGLLLMLPNMYKMAGECYPAVIHVAARTVATHALSIFGDHSDIYAARTTGFNMLCASNVQEAQDFAVFAHVTALKAQLPFLHFFDGFRTSHEIHKIETIDDAVLQQMLPKQAFLNFKKSAQSSAHPTQRGTAQNQDVYFQNRELSEVLYRNVPTLLEQTMREFQTHTGRSYHLFDYEGAPDATDVIVAMGSGTETIAETVAFLQAQGKKVGVVKVRLFRPFSAEHFLNALPLTTKNITVLDRTKECGAMGEPLYEEVCTVLQESARNKIKTFAGRYGLASKEFTPAMVVAVFENMQAKAPKNHFSVGIQDDILHNSLPINHAFYIPQNGTMQCKFYGLGSDGTVSANKASIQIIGQQTPLYAQGYFMYDSKKSGGVTVSHLRFGKEPIRSTYLVEHPNFVACHNPTFLQKFDCLEGIAEHGIFLLNAPWDMEMLEKELPAQVKQTLAKKQIQIYIIDAQHIAQTIGLNKRINTIMQACFFKLTKLLPWETVKTLMKEAATKNYASKGDAVVQMNYKAIDVADEYLQKVVVPAHWLQATSNASNNAIEDAYYTNFINPILSMKGDALPLSAFSVKGEVKTSTSRLEKRNIATSLPAWIAENCIQCNQCALVCPHACLRPILLPENSPLIKEVGAVPALGIPGYYYKMQLSPMDCTGCGNCAHVCPALKKALEMQDKEKILDVQAALYYKLRNVDNPATMFSKFSVKGSQFERPLFEYSGACAGCGETPYIKLLTQLFGSTLMIANATGCSSIYGGSCPTCPYTTDKNGRGPSWSNSLFEDNAEFALGMHVANQENERHLEEKMKTLTNAQESVSALAETWLAKENRTVELAQEIEREIVLNMKRKDSYGALYQEIYALRNYFVPQTVWAIGGDGWAYDIGFGGIDHVISTNENVKILVLDTEVYSNTGGQASKATPIGSVAKFATTGKTTQKKDLARIAMTYPNCYVAQVSMGANPAQTIQAFKEAQEHNGPSIIIAYCPCINHGIDMSQTQAYEKEAVTSGYWNLFRYNPNHEHPLTLDPPFPATDIQAFLQKQSRYFTLIKKNPTHAEQLLDAQKEHAKQHYQTLKQETEN